MGELPNLLTFPSLVIDGSRWGLDVTTLRYNDAARVLYVGRQSQDLRRPNLVVFKVGAYGTLLSDPTMFPDHPERLVPQPGGQLSAVNCIASDRRWPRTLYLGVRVSNVPHFTTPLVVYNLDADGLPVGTPGAFNFASPWGQCWSLAFHPSKPWLYAVGWGFTAVAAWALDSKGMPVGQPVVHPVGGQGKISVGVTTDGSMLCLGSYPWLLEILQLQPDGSPGQLVGSHPLSHGTAGADYVPLSVGNREVYYISQNGLLAYFGFNSAGKQTHAGETTFTVRALGRELNAGPLVVGVDHNFTDALTGTSKLDGCILQEISTDNAGVPVAVAHSGGAALREQCVRVSSLPAPAIAATPLSGFLGNRVAGLGLRASVPALTATGVLALDATSFAFPGPQDYLRFAYSATSNTIYAAGNNVLTTVSLSTSPDTVISSVPCPEATGLLCVDASRRFVYAARSDGVVAAFSLDAKGVPSLTASFLKSGLSAISCFCLHAETGKLYAFGPEANSATDLRIVPIAGGIQWREAVAVPALGRCYACSHYNGHDNLWVWQLGPDGVPTGAPSTLFDGLPDGAFGRGMVSGVRVDAARRRLYLGGNSEFQPTGSQKSRGAIIVYTLDPSGLPTGAPRVYPSSNRQGVVSAIELAAGRLYESGWGDPTIFAWVLQPDGQPSGVKHASSTGIYGKQHLQVTADGATILAGTYPTTLERAPVLANGDLRAGAHATFAIGSQTADLGVLGPGLGASIQVDLDPFLRDKTGTALGTITLSIPVGTVTAADVRFDITRKVAGAEVGVRSVDATVHGNQAALLLPFYGIDDEGQLAASVEGSTDRYQQYQLWAQAAASPVGGGSLAPSQTVIANGLIGLDASPGSLAAGLKTLALLGHNTIQAWSFDGMTPAEMVAAAGATGFQRFRSAIYSPPAYFDYEPDIADPRKREGWATSLARQTTPNVPSLDRLALFHMADEPGWYYPSVSDAVRGNLDYLKVFQNYLRGTGLPASAFGGASFAQLTPGTLSQATRPEATVESKRLLFWTARFFAESASRGFAAATAALRQHLNGGLLVTANFNNQPGRFFTPSPNQKIGNNPNTGPDAAMGAPDWFDFGRRKAVTCLWTEDWFPDQSAQAWSFYGDLLRCAAANGGIAFGGYVVGKTLATQPQAIPDGVTYKIMALAGRGAQALDLYTFGQALVYGDSWSDNRAVYGPVARALQLLGTAERLRGGPGTMRRGTVALLFPQASQVWDPGPGEYRYLSELSGLHAALIHAQYPVDFVDDVDVETGALVQRGYKALYVSAPNLSDTARQAILSWVNSGGTLVLLPGACRFDCYDQPTADITPAAGAESAPVPRLTVPHGQERLLQPELTITRAEASFPVQTTATRFKAAPLTPATRAKVLASFADGAGVVLNTTGTKGGRVISFGYWPGLTYMATPDYDFGVPNPLLLHLPRGWGADARAIATMPARLSGALKHAEIPIEGIELLILDTATGCMVTLLNWFSPVTEPTILTVHTTAHPACTAISARHGTLSVQAGPTSILVTLPSLDTVDVIILKSQPK